MIMFTFSYGNPCKLVTKLVLQTKPHKLKQYIKKNLQSEQPNLIHYLIIVELLFVHVPLMSRAKLCVDVINYLLFSF